MAQVGVTCMGSGYRYHSGMGAGWLHETLHTHAVPVCPHLTLTLLTHFPSICDDVMTGTMTLTMLTPMM